MHELGIIPGIHSIYCSMFIRSIGRVCIEKSSSAKLSEAISSMFQWYERSVACYAYLEDARYPGNLLKNSRSFTRGWTLQELLAPARVEFFSQDWQVHRHKDQLKA